MHNNNSDSIGNGFEIRSFILQLHYKHAMKKEETDCSGVSIIATSKPLVYHVITIYIYNVSRSYTETYLIGNKLNTNELDFKILNEHAFFFNNIKKNPLLKQYTFL